MTPQFPISAAWLAEVTHASLKFSGERLISIGSGPTALAWRSIIRNLPSGSIYCHTWLRGDPDDLHDHPWDWCSVILRGGYYEVSQAGRTWRAEGSVMFRKAEELHRVELHPDVPQPVSLFITGERRRAWGFQTPDGWVDGELYRDHKPGAKRSAKAGVAA